MNSPTSNQRSALPVQIEQELVSGGFAWDRKPEPISFVDMPPPQKAKKPPTPEQRERSRRAKAKQREKWIAMGIIKPRDQWLAEVKKRA